MSESRRAVEVASALLEAGRAADALDVLGPFLVSGDLDALRLGGYAANTAGRPGDGLLLSRRLLTADPEDVGGWSNLAFSHALLGEAEQAREAVLICGQFGPEEWWTHTDAATIDLLTGRVGPDSITHALTGVRLGPEEPAAHHTLGVVLQSLGNSQGADECFRRALRIDPQFRASLFGSALAAVQQGNAAAATEGLLRALAIDPSNARAIETLGGIIGRAFLIAAMVVALPAIMGVLGWADLQDAGLQWLYVAHGVVSVSAIAAALAVIRRRTGRRFAIVLRRVAVSERLLATSCAVLATAALMFLISPFLPSPAFEALYRIAAFAALAAMWGILARTGPLGRTTPPQTIDDADVLARARALASERRFTEAYSILAPALAAGAEAPATNALAAGILRSLDPATTGPGAVAHRGATVEGPGARVVTLVGTIEVRAQLCVAIATAPITVLFFVWFMDASAEAVRLAMPAILAVAVITSAAWCLPLVRRLRRGDVRIARATSPQIGVMGVALAFTLGGLLVAVLVPDWFAIFGVLAALVGSFLGMLFASAFWQDRRRLAKLTA